VRYLSRVNPVVLNEQQAATVGQILIEELEATLPAGFVERLVVDAERNHRFDIPMPSGGARRKSYWSFNLWAAEGYGGCPLHLGPANDSAVPTIELWGRARGAAARLQELYDGSVLPGLMAKQGPRLRLSSFAS
jgi:hypothetical protein